MTAWLPFSGEVSWDMPQGEANEDAGKHAWRAIYL